MNMWCLWSLGRLSERLFGKWQTFVIYMLTGVGGALLSIAWDQGRNELGASGAVFGLVGAVMAGVKFGDLNISSGEKRAIFSSAASFAVLNFVLGMSSGGIFGNIDNMCHLGGFVSGLLIGLPLGAFARRHPLYQLATLMVTALVLAAAGRELVQVYGPEAQKRVAAYEVQQRDYAKAARLLEKYTAAKPNDDVGLIMLGEVYVANNERDKAIAAFEQALKANPNAEEAKQVLQELRGDGSPQK
jgi:rhomboid protease GluP